MSKPVAGAIAAVVAVLAIGAVLWGVNRSGGTPAAGGGSSQAPSSQGLTGPASSAATGTVAPGATSTGTGTSRTAPADPVLNPAGDANPPLPAAAADAALCQVRTAEIRSLLGGAQGDAQYEALRDAIPALSERTNEVQSVATGRPALNPVVTTLRGVYTDWGTALSSYDSGAKTAGAQALQSSNTKISALDAVLEKASPASANC